MKNKFLLIFAIIIITILGSFLFLRFFFLSTLKSNDQKIYLGVTIYPIYYFLKSLTKDSPNLEVIFLGQTIPDPHHFEITPHMFSLLMKVDYLIYTGTYLDSWVLKVKEKFPNLKLFSPTERLNFIKIDDFIDPHFWHSLDEDKKVIDDLLSFLIEIDPNNQNLYENNYQKLIDKLEETKNFAQTELKALKQTKIVTKHNAFSYLARDFKLEIVGYLEKEEGELTPKEVEHLVSKIRENNIKSLFGEVGAENQKVINFARNLNLKVYYLHSLERSDKDFFEAYHENILTLKEALNQ